MKYSTRNLGSSHGAQAWRSRRGMMQKSFARQVSPASDILKLDRREIDARLTRPPMSRSFDRLLVIYGRRGFVWKSTRRRLRIALASRFVSGSGSKAEAEDDVRIPGARRCWASVLRAPRCLSEKNRQTGRAGFTKAILRPPRTETRCLDCLPE